MKVLCSGYNKKYNKCDNCTHRTSHEMSNSCDMVCGQDYDSCCSHSVYVVSLRKIKLDILKEVSNEGR